jgi:sugar/nucleoside kinase (ribokinase family)
VNSDPRTRDDFDLVGIGQCSIDYVCRVDGIPAVGGKAAMLGYALLPGGQIATALLAAARLGLRTAFVGSVGSDAIAEFVLAPLAAAGVDLAGVRRVPSAATRLAVILVDRASGERTVLGHRDPRLCLTVEDLPESRIERARCLLVDAEDSEVSRAAAILARSRGVPVVADVDAPGPGVEALLAAVDFPLVSRSFAEALARDGTIRGGLDRLVQLGARMAVATLGDRGCLARVGDREIASPAFAIAPHDTTGAGDVFHAAFAWGLLEGWSGEQLLRTANAAAARACRGFGAQGELPTRSELEAFLCEREPGPWHDPELRS